MVNFRAGLIANQFPFLSTRMLMRSVYHGTIFDNLICFQIILFGLLFFTFFRIDLDRYGLACKMLNDVGTFRRYALSTGTTMSLVRFVFLRSGSIWVIICCGAQEAGRAELGVDRHSVWVVYYYTFEASCNWP